MNHVAGTLGSHRSSGRIILLRLLLYWTSTKKVAAFLSTTASCSPDAHFPIMAPNRGHNRAAEFDEFLQTGSKGTVYLLRARHDTTQRRLCAKTLSQILIRKKITTTSPTTVTAPLHPTLRTMKMPAANIMRVWERAVCAGPRRWLWARSIEVLE